MINSDSPLIGAIGTLFDNLIKAKIGFWAGRVLSALGLGFAAQEFIYDPMIDQAVQYWAAIPASIAKFLHAVGIDTGVSIILSAFGIRGVERIFLARRQSNL